MMSSAFAQMKNGDLYNKSPDPYGSHILSGEEAGYQILTPSKEEKESQIETVKEKEKVDDYEPEEDIIAKLPTPEPLEVLFETPNQKPGTKWRVKPKKKVRQRMEELAANEDSPSSSGNDADREQEADSIAKSVSDTGSNNSMKLLDINDIVHLQTTSLKTHTMNNSMNLMQRMEENVITSNDEVVDNVLSNEENRFGFKASGSSSSDTSQESKRRKKFSYSSRYKE